MNPHRRIVATLARRAWMCGLIGVLMVFHAGCIRFHRRGDMEIVRGNASAKMGRNLERRIAAAMSQAMDAYQMGDVDAAMAGFQQVVELDPGHGQAHNNLGLIYYDRHQLALAATHFDAAAEFLPGNASPLNNLGMTLEAGGRMDDAIELYRRASALNPKNPLYLGNLVKAKLKMGHRDDLLYSQMQSLLMIENRPHWITWVRDQLNLDLNPLLDRGGETELSLTSGTTEPSESETGVTEDPMIQSSQIPLPPPVIIEDPRGDVPSEFELPGAMPFENELQPESLPPPLEMPPNSFMDPSF